MDDLYKKAFDTASGAEGWLTEGEGKYLFEAAKRAAGGVILEIGSYEGKSTLFLGNGSLRGFGKKVYAVDPHDGGPDLQKPGQIINTLEAFNTNMKKGGIDAIVETRVMKSEEAEKDWTQPISLLFIDGAHEYKYAEQDFLLWEKHVIEGGEIAFHDTSVYNVIFDVPGPRAVVYKYVINSGKYKDIGYINSIMHGKKTAKMTAGDKLAILLFKANQVVRFIRAYAGLFIKGKLPKKII
jgi:predicted O-methyltransferase YrrM